MTRFVYISSVGARTNLQIARGIDKEEPVPKQIKGVKPLKPELDNLFLFVSLPFAKYSITHRSLV